MSVQFCNKILKSLCCQSTVAQSKLEPIAILLVTNVAKRATHSVVMEILLLVRQEMENLFNSTGPF